MKKKLFISLTKETVFLCLFNDEKEKSLVKTCSKGEINEKLISLIGEMFKESNFSIENLESIFLKNRKSSWNANRLILLFCKTISKFKNISLFVWNDEGDLSDSDEINWYCEKKFLCNLKYYLLVIDLDSLVPFYNTCKVINT